MGASIEADHDNIPLRITLLLIDEVFDLKDKNIWLRRQMITVLRQIVKTMFGDTVNKRIVDYFATFTAPEAVAGYLNTVKDHLWPGMPCLGEALKCVQTKCKKMCNKISLQVGDPKWVTLLVCVCLLINIFRWLPTGRANGEGRESEAANMCRCQGGAFLKLVR